MTPRTVSGEAQAITEKTPMSIGWSLTIFVVAATAIGANVRLQVESEAAAKERADIQGRIRTLEDGAHRIDTRATLLEERFIRIGDDVKETKKLVEDAIKEMRRMTQPGRHR